MHFPRSASLLFALSAASCSIAAPDTFYLRSQTNAESSDPTKGDLYLHSYHTGAGLSDATLEADKTDAPIFYLNDTYLEFNVGNGLFFSAALGGDTNYAAWDPVTINAGQLTSGFSIDSTDHLVWNSTEFAGWIACDWWHGVPQLFWKYYYYTYPLPSSCSEIELIAECA